ncbi:MAG: hypothetical protein RL215_3111, partial [Planctomycetota bacterium]
MSVKNPEKHGVFAASELSKTTDWLELTFVVRGRNVCGTGRS